MTRRRFNGILAATLFGAGLSWSDPACAQAEADELFRYRIANELDGAIELSTDRGQIWQQLGKVTRPATATGVTTSAITVAPAGSVAGVTPDTVTVRVGVDRLPNRLLRIQAQGQADAVGSISTDLPSRSALFRLLAPSITSRVLLLRAEKTAALPTGYVPREGDRLLIIVPRPLPGTPPTVTLENRVNGEVVLTATGGTPQLLARVQQPLRGVGRYTGTERAGSGSVVSWSPTLVMVSTAGPLHRKDANGEAVEERGGFILQPAEPALRGATHPASQVLLDAISQGPTKPQVSPFFALATALSSGDPLDPLAARVEVKLDGGEWEPFPDLRGPVGEEGMLQALQAAVGAGRTVKQGITHMRLSLSGATEESLTRRVRLATTPVAGRPQRGVVSVSANVMGEGIVFVEFHVDGVLAKVTNQPPFNWEWNTLQYRNGEHLLEIRGLDNKLSVVSTVTTRVIVDN